MENLNIKNIKPLSEFRNNIKKYIEEINATKKPIVVTQRGKSAAVVMNVDEFQQIQDQIEFMKKVIRGLDDYKKDKVYSKTKSLTRLQNNHFNNSTFKARIK